jgi:hypothetical protein
MYLGMFNKRNFIRTKINHEQRQTHMSVGTVMIYTTVEKPSVFVSPRFTKKAG